MMLISESNYEHSYASEHKGRYFKDELFLIYFVCYEIFVFC